jgi:limonene-1,2-epoxide hydrolase
MAKPRPLDVADSFVKAINRHDVEGIIGMTTPNHRFLDALGRTVTGTGPLAEAWTGYFELFPDYHVSISRRTSDGRVVGLFGTASGSFNRRNFEIPAAWMAKVAGKKVSEWRVYADNEPVWKLLGVKRY